MSMQSMSGRLESMNRFLWTSNVVRFVPDSTLESYRRGLREEKDGDGDGKINDGKPNEAPAPPKEPKAKKATSPFSAGHVFTQPITNEQLNKASKVFQAFEEGTELSVVADYQMRGGVLKNGRFKGFDAKTKQRNMNKLIEEVDDLRASDPESFEIARQYAVAEAFGAEDYASVPDTVTVWRGHDSEEKLSSRGVNVTHKREIANDFGANGIVSEYKINKKDVLFPLSNSAFDEGELIIEKPTKVLKKTNEYVSDYVKTSRKVDAIKPGDSINFKDGQTGVLLARGVGLSMIVKLPNGDVDYAVQAEDINL